MGKGIQIKNVLLLQRRTSICYGALPSIPTTTSKEENLSTKSTHAFWSTNDYSKSPHQIDVFEQLMNEAEKKVCSEQRHFNSVRDYWEAIETVAKAMMNAMEKEETEKAVEEKKSSNKETKEAPEENIKQAEGTPILTKAPEEPVAKKEVVKTFKRFGSKVNVNEDMEK